MTSNFDSVLNNQEKYPELSELTCTLSLKLMLLE